MSILIDELIKNRMHRSHHEEIGGSWYIAKPLNVKYKSLKQRFKDALSVLYGNAFAVHYFEDEANTWGEIRG